MSRNRGENESDKKVVIYRRIRCRRASGHETEGHHLLLSIKGYSLEKQQIELPVPGAHLHIIVT